MITKWAAAIVAFCYFLVEAILYCAITWIAPIYGFNVFSEQGFFVGILLLIVMLIVAIPIIDGILYFFGKSKGIIVSKAANIGESSYIM